MRSSKKEPKKREPYGSEGKLKKLEELLAGEKIDSINSLARKAGISYSYTTTLVNILEKNGVDVSSVRIEYGYAFKGNKAKRDKMIVSGEYSLREIGKKFGISWQAVASYIRNNHDYDEWLKLREDHIKRFGRKKVGIR